MLILLGRMINDTDTGVATLPKNALLEHVCEVLKRDGSVSQSQLYFPLRLNLLKN
jgi:hypothetical protein